MLANEHHSLQNSPHETISPEVLQGTPATASTSASGRGQPPPQLVRRGRQATLARFSSLLNQMLVEQFENAAAAAVANDDTTQASNNGQILHKVVGIFF